MQHPNCAPAHLWYGHHLAIQGRFQEAVREANLAPELEPLSPVIKTHIGWLLHFDHKYYEAVSHHQSVLQMDPDWVWALWQLGQARTNKSTFAEAIGTSEKVMALSRRRSAIAASLGAARAPAGRMSEAQRVLQEFIELSEISVNS